ncbi:hypothetical protein [Rhizohabitans arisaemae]|uniref:hypothetical protein n=1 Tax=Rhizohabitans arisaemae TaxID=2720610 RepID=UPI0024B1DBB1|nr:hypothetical protein [Rhizohabitans arisaemae]
MGWIRPVRAFAVTLAVLALSGVAAGLLWGVVAPRVSYVVTASGPRLADPTTQDIIAGDGWFAVVTGAAGLVSGVVGYLLGRGRPVAVLLGLAAGGLLGAFVAFQVGGMIDAEPVALTLRATGVLFAWPLIAVAVFGLIEGSYAYRDTPWRRPYAGLDPQTPLPDRLPGRDGRATP